MSGDGKGQPSLILKNVLPQMGPYSQSVDLEQQLVLEAPHTAQ